MMVFPINLPPILLCFLLDPAETLGRTIVDHEGELVENATLECSSRIPKGLPRHKASKGVKRIAPEVGFLPPDRHGHHGREDDQFLARDRKEHPMSVDAEDALTEMLCRAFPLANGDQLSRGTEQFRRIVENEHRRAARAERSMLADYLRNTGHYAAVDLIRKLPND